MGLENNSNLEHQKDRKSKCAFVYVCVCVCLFCLYDRNEIRGYGLLAAYRGLSFTLVFPFFPVSQQTKTLGTLQRLRSHYRTLSEREKKDGTYRFEVRTRGSGFVLPR